MPHSSLVPIWSNATAAQSVPLDSQLPNSDQGVQDANGIRGQRFVIETDATVSSGTGTATVAIYLWDGSRWAKSDVSISLTITATASGPASRRVFELDTIFPYLAIDPVLEAITGTGASVTCRSASR